MNSVVRVCLMAAVVGLGLGLASDADARGCFNRFKRDRCCKPACCEPVSDCGCGAPADDCGCGVTGVAVEEGTVVEPTEASPSDSPAVPEPPAAEEGDAPAEEAAEAATEAAA